MSDPWLLSSFEPEEAQTVADFLVAVVGLEAQVKQLLAEYYAQPDRREGFYEQFLKERNLGQVLRPLRPVLDHFGLEAEHADLREVLELRNVIAHRAPEDNYCDDDGNGIVLWKGRNDEVVVIADIEARRVVTRELTDVMRRLRARLAAEA